MKETWLLLVLAFFAFSNVACGFRQPAGPVKNYVVLMMENRAYDHLLGYYQMPGNHLEGLTGHEYNPWNPNEPNSRRIMVSPDAKDVRICNTIIPLVIKHSRLLLPILPLLMHAKLKNWPSNNQPKDISQPRSQCQWHHRTNFWHSYPQTRRCCVHGRICKKLQSACTNFSNWHLHCWPSLIKSNSLVTMLHLE